MTPISTYLEKIQREYASGSATEHSYRPALKELVESLLPGMLAINEPKRIECGAPDFSITKPMDGVAQGLPIGYIEAKDIVTLPRVTDPLPS